MRYENLPTHESMKRPHVTRKFRRSNFEHGLERRWKSHVNKPWRTHNPLRSTAA